MLSSSHSHRSHFPGSLGRALPSQSLRDVIDDKYQELRRPKRVIFYCNGDRYFPGIFMRITPHRFLNFTDLLSDLTSKIPQHINLPAGVRSIFTPLGGRRITDIEQLKDKGRYVCAGNDAFRPVHYGSVPGMLHSVNPHHHDPFLMPPSAIYVRHTHPNSRSPAAFLFPQSRYQRFWGGQGPRGSLQRIPGVDPVSVRPKVVTVVRHSRKKPHETIKVLLNRNSVQSFNQLMADISGAFGPKWKNDKLRRLVTLDGREVQGATDLFRSNDVFVGVGNDDLTEDEIRSLLNEVDPDNPDKENLVKQWMKRMNKNKGRGPASDSGYEESDASNGSNNSNNEYDGTGTKRIPPLGYTYRQPPYYPRNRRRRRDPDSASRLRRRPPWLPTNHPGLAKDPRPEMDTYPIVRETQTRARELERLRAAQGERERARRIMLARLEAERQSLDEARRRRGLPSLKEVYGTPRPIRATYRRPEDEGRSGRRREAAERAMRRREEEERLGREAAAKKKGDRGRGRGQAVVDGNTGGRRRAKGTVAGEDEDSRGTGDEDDEDMKKRKGVRRVGIMGVDNREGDGEPVGGSENDGSEGNKDGDADIHSDGKADGEKEQANEVEDEPDGHGKLPFKKFSIASFVDKNHPSLLSAGTEQHPPRSSRSERPPGDPVLQEEEEEEEKEEAKGKEEKPHDSFIRQVTSSREVLDKYELGRTIGDGNFAVVKAAREKATGKEYAVKIIDKKKLKGRNHMVVNEVETMRQCKHPNIVQLKEEYESPKEIFLVMELVKGGDLFDAITQSVKFGEAESASMVKDILEALFYLHQRNIVHRDLKPENVLLMRKTGGKAPLVKLADFGLAQKATEAIFMVCGTPTYVAPEILEEKGYGIEVDLWAVGVITYILLCGFPPFRSPDRNQTELFEFIKAGEFEFLAPYWNGISRTAKDFVQRLLIVNPKKRYTAIDALCHQWILTLGGAEPLQNPLDEVQRERRRELESRNAVVT